MRARNSFRNGLRFVDGCKQTEVCSHTITLVNGNECAFGNPILAICQPFLRIYEYYILYILRLQLCEASHEISCWYNNVLLQRDLLNFGLVNFKSKEIKKIWVHWCVYNYFIVDLKWSFSLKVISGFECIYASIKLFVLNGRSWKFEDLFLYFAWFRYMFVYIWPFSS